jgi:predicted transglutaminase-like cysteine proteinase
MNRLALQCRRWSRTSTRSALGVSAWLLVLLCAHPAQAWDASIIRSQAAQRGGPVVRAANQVLQLVESASSRSEIDRARAINDHFNRVVAFREDQQVWSQVDYWASPLELLEKGAGDCEDFALAKYFSLLMAGVAPAKLRLVYVRAQIPSAPNGVQAHMVLAYYSAPRSEPWILDNLVKSVDLASRRVDLVPVFSFNSEGLWVGHGSERVGDAVARLSRWSDVLAKARREGFL